MAKQFQGIKDTGQPLVKPEAVDYPGAYDPKAEIAPSLEKPGAIPLPLPNAGQPELASTDDIKNAVRGLNAGLQSVPENPWTKAKTQKFNAGIDGLQFERYYNHPKFKQLGFSPFRNNEELYNEESNFIHDASRSWTQFGKIAGLGFADAAGFGSLTDIGTAKDYEKAMAIGSSSRGGAGGFTTNLFMNSAYTVGIIGETMLEELGLALITGASGGLASEVTIPTMIGRGMRASNKLHTAYNVGKNILRTLNSLKDANKARKYFTQAAKGAGRFLNPLEESMNFLNGMNKIDNLTKMAQTAHGFASFYRDVRNVRLAWGEAGLEGGMVANDLSEELLNEHLEKFGKAPTKEEADRIRETAMQAGMSTGYQNIFAIYYSNKIVFDNLFKGFRPLSKLADEGVDFGAAGKIVQKKLKKGDPVRPYVHVEKNWKTMLKAAKDPLTYGTTALGYFKANVAEGLQESAQEIISGATMDSYREEWRGSPMKGGYLAAVADNMQKQMTPQGLEVFMSGFLMGGMIQPVTKAPGYLTQKWQKFRDPAGYTAQKEQQKEYINETVNKLNDLYENVADQLEPDMDHMTRQNAVQKGMDEASRTGNEYEFHNLKDTGNFDNVFTALKHGRLDSFIERLEDLKQLTSEDIEESYGMDQPAFIKRLDTTIANAKRIEQRYDISKENMSNPHDPSIYQKGSTEQKEAMINKAAWDDALKKFLFLQESFDRNLARKTEILGDVQDDTKLAKVATTEFMPLFNIDDGLAEVKLLDAEIKALKGATGTTLTDRNKKEKKRTLLKQFTDDMTAVIRALDLKDTEEGLDSEKALKKAKKTYKSYLKHVAKSNKDHVFDNNVDKSFQKLVEYYMRDAETVTLNDAVNKMLDPGVFTREVGRAAKLEELRVAQRQAELKIALEAYVKQMDTQRLMQLLYDDQTRDGQARKRMFFDPEELVALLDEGKMPTNFYYASETGEVAQVPRNSNDFREAVGIITEFVPNILDIPISEADINDARNQYTSKAREKDENDKRTYEDLAKQYGFDPTVAESKIPLAVVLQAVIDSPYGTKDEAYLAKELLKKVSEGEIVTFTKTGTSPGYYSPSVQTVIDARYNSSNYQNAGMPIEHVILHEEIHRRTVEEIELDPAFRKSIEALYETTLLHFKSKAKKDDAIPYGLASVQEFIAETMTNSNFQQQLAEIPHEGTAAPVWNSFVDAVLKMLKDVFGRSISNSVLNEAMAIITTKIDSRFITQGSKEEQPIEEAQAAPVEGPERTLDNTKVTQTIKKVDLLSTTHTSLATDLLEAYNVENATLKTEERTLLDPDYAEKTDDEILNSRQFQTYYKSPRSTVQTIFENYNLRTNRTVDPLMEAVSPQNAGVAVRRALEAKGYTSADIRAMTVPEQVVLANDPRGKAEQAAAQVADQDQEAQVRARLKTKIRADVEGLIAGATTLEELEIRREKITEILNQRTAPNAPNSREISEYKAEELDKLYNDKLKELAFSFTYDDIMVGATIELKNKKKMYITKKTDDQIVGHKVGVPTEIIVVKKRDIKQKVKFVVTAAAINANLEGLPDEFTPENQDVASQNDETITSTEDTVDEDWDSEDDGEEADPGCIT